MTDPSRLVARAERTGATARVEHLCDPADVASQRAALQAGFGFEGVRRAAGPDGRDLHCWVRLPGDRPGPRARLLPDPPPGGLGDGVVLVRPEGPADAQVLWETVSDPDTVRWSVLPLGTYADFVARLALSESAWLIGASAGWAVCDAATGEVVGDVGLRVVDALLGRANLGYSIHPAWRGRGLAGRAATLVARWGAGLPGLHRIEASAALGNAASLEVLERAGFVREGVLRGLLPSWEGQRQDAVQYSWPV